MCSLHVDKEQRCSRNSFVLERLKSPKLQHLQRRRTDRQTVTVIMLWLPDTHVWAGFIIMDQPGQAWLDVTLREPIPGSGEPSRTSRPSDWTTATQTQSDCRSANHPEHRWSPPHLPDQCTGIWSPHLTSHWTCGDKKKEKENHANNKC